MPGARLPLRVGFAGTSAGSGLAAGVEAVAIGARRRWQRSEEWPERLDALVVDRPSAEVPAERLLASVKRARAEGVPVIGLRRGGEAPVWEGQADIETGAGSATLRAAPAVDVERYNPVHFSGEGVSGFVAVMTPGASSSRLPEAFAALREAARFDPVTVRGEFERVRVRLPDDVVAGVGLDPAGENAVAFLHKRLGVVDHPALHESEYERAGWLAKLCAAGVPVAAAEISDELAELLGAELAGLLAAVRSRDLTDLAARERLSVALRRLGLRGHSAQARWRALCGELGIDLPGRPMVSVIFSTRRASWLEHGIAQVARQTYQPRELVVCLHGEEFEPGTSERVGALYDGPFKVIHVDGELTLGDALNAGVEVSEGELVTKMDDDDFYSVEHLWDLVLAVEYAQADLVGKAAEFVYLEEIDVTIRQISQDTQTRLAGGGMMARKEPLRAIGGWSQRSRGEDLALIRSFAGAGRPIHRIPPHGYILNRHGRDHTWRPQVDYFLFRSDRQWRGLDFAETAIEPPTDPYTRVPVPAEAEAQSSG